MDNSTDPFKMYRGREIKGIIYCKNADWLLKGDSTQPFFEILYLYIHIWVTHAFNLLWSHTISN